MISTVSSSVANAPGALPSIQPMAASKVQVSEEEAKKMARMPSLEGVKGFQDPKTIMENVHEAIEQTNQELARNGQSLAFSIDKSVTIPVVSVHNMHTGELIRQIPSETLVKSAQSIDKLKGLMWESTS